MDILSKCVSLYSKERDIFNEGTEISYKVSCSVSGFSCADISIVTRHPDMVNICLRPVNCQILKCFGAYFCWNKGYFNCFFPTIS